jgi:hypothetical protein
MRRKIVAGLLCICFVLLLFDSVLAQDQQQRRTRRMPRWKPELEIGDKVQDFELQILDGGTFKLSEKRGTIIVLELGACT